MEEKKNKQEELQTRREFFKKAAKGVLPVLGAIALANVPLLSHAMEEGKTPNGCSSSCFRACADDCYTSCKNTCRVYCTGTCQNTCQGSCSGRCQGSCATGCGSSAYYGG